MPRYFVKNKKNEWNVFSSIIDDFLFDNFISFEQLKNEMIEEKIKEYDKELDSLLTDRPILNVMDYEEATQIIKELKEQV